MMGSRGGGDDAVGGVSMEIGNAVGIAGDFRGERQKFQAIEESFGHPLFEGRAQGEPPVGLFLGNLDDADG